MALVLLLTVMVTLLMSVPLSVTGSGTCTGRAVTLRFGEGFLPLLDKWADLDARGGTLGIKAGMPILMDPAGRVEPRLGIVRAILVVKAP